MVAESKKCSGGPGEPSAPIAAKLPQGSDVLSDQFNQGRGRTTDASAGRRLNSLNLELPSMGVGSAQVTQPGLGAQRDRSELQTSEEQHVDLAQAGDQKAASAK